MKGLLFGVAASLLAIAALPHLPQLFPERQVESRVASISLTKLAEMAELTKTGGLGRGTQAPSFRYGVE